MVVRMIQCHRRRVGNPGIFVLIVRDGRGFCIYDLFEKGFAQAADSEPKIVPLGISYLGIYNVHWLFSGAYII